MFVDLDEGNVALVIYLTLEILYVFDHFIRRLSDLEYLVSITTGFIEIKHINSKHQAVNKKGIP